MIRWSVVKLRFRRQTFGRAELRGRQTNEAEQCETRASGSGLSVSGSGIWVREACHLDGMMNTQKPDLMWALNPSYH